MQPFSITCHSCAAKLKVTRESAIGQLLGCPKCGTMIHVKAPPGYRPPIADSSAHFGDVDSILGNDSDDDTVVGTPRGSVKSPTRETKKKSKPKKAAGSIPGVPIPKRLKEKKAEENRPSKKVPTPNRLPANSTKSSKAQVTNHAAKKPGKRKQKPTASTAQPIPIETVATTKRAEQTANASAENNKTVTDTATSVAVNPSSGEGPLLPNEQWVSESTQNKKRLIRLIAMATLGVVLTMVLCYSLIQYMNRSGQMYPGVAKDQPTNELEIVSPDENDPHIDEGLNSADVENSDIVPSEGDTTENAEPPEENPQPIVDGAPPSVEIPAIGNEPPKVDQPGFGDPAAMPNDNEKPKIQFDDSVPIGGPPLATSEKTPATTVTVEEDNSLGKLSALLERTGTSILEIQDLALAERDRFGVGQPKYFIESVEHDPVNFDRQVAIPIDGAQYQSVSLRQAYAELTAISGLTFSIDPIAAVRYGVPTNPKIDLMIEGKTLEEAANELAASASMMLQKVDTGFRIGQPPQTELTEATYDLAPIVGNNQELGAQLAAVTRGFVAPGSWPENPTADQPSAIVEGTALKVKQTRWPQQLAGDLISALAAIKQDQQTELKTNVVVVSSSVAPGSPLSKPPQLTLTARRTLSQLFEELEANTEVSVLANWNALAGLGWTPDALAPGRIDEPTANDLIRQIAHSMGLTVYIVDQKTVLLTTFEDAATNFDLRVYSTRPVTAKGISRADLERLITESLGAQLRAGGVQLQIIESCDALIVHAPQSLHRQVETVLGRFE